MLSALQQYVCKKLSQKIRHIRWIRNKKSVPVSGQQQPRKRRRMCDFASVSEGRKC